MRSGKGEQAVQVLLAGLKCICYLALFLGMQVLVMMPVTLAAILQDGMTGGLVDDDALLSTLTEYSMVYSFLSGMLTIAFVLVFYLIRRKKLSEALWLRRVPAHTLWVGAAVAPGLYVLVVIVLSILPSSWQDSYSEASSNLDGGGLFAVLAIALVAPVVEEFIFRGLIMTRLSRLAGGAALRRYFRGVPCPPSVVRLRLRVGYGVRLHGSAGGFYLAVHLGACGVQQYRPDLQLFTGKRERDRGDRGFRDISGGGHHSPYPGPESHRCHVPACSQSRTGAGAAYCPRNI